MDTPLRQLTRGIGRAAVAGFGLSLGRDLYRIAKRLLALGLYVALPFLWLILPIIAGRMLTRRSNAFDIVIGFLSLLGGAFTCILAAVFITSYDLTGRSNSDQLTSMLAMSALLLAGGLTVGVWLGLRDREAQHEALSIADRNSEFLMHHGIRETGGKHITHYDSNETPLRFLETHHDRLLFMVVGARGKRAQVILNPDGLMISYSGVF